MSRYNIRQLLCAYWVLLLWGSTHLRSVLSSGDDHQCTSTFHVWQPGQDAQRMITELHLRMDNVTTYSKLQVAELRAHLSDELNRINNWTFVVDKRMLEMQVNGVDEEMVQMKYDSRMSRMQTQIDHTVRRITVEGQDSGRYRTPDNLAVATWFDSSNRVVINSNRPARYGHHCLMNQTKLSGVLSVQSPVPPL